jgi:hypothetical protein
MHTLLFVTIVVLLGCPAPSDKRAPADWQTQQMDEVVHGECQGVLAFLDTHKELRTSRLWYVIYATAAEQCAHANKDRAYLARALPVLDEGRRTFPQSAEMPLHRAVLLAQTGQLDDAVSSYRDAKTVATAALQSTATDEDKEAAREVLKHIDANIAATEQLRKARRK